MTAYVIMIKVDSEQPISQDTLDTIQDCAEFECPQVLTVVEIAACEP